MTESPSTPREVAATLTPLYSCALPSCADEVTFPADNLYWFDGNGEFPAGFYCEGDWEEIKFSLSRGREDEDDYYYGIQPGISLERALDGNP